MSDKTKLEWALEHAAKGWPVFPLIPNLKLPPKGHHGRNEATTDVDVIKAWWAENPEFNIGIDTDGAGLVVVDLDVSKDDTAHNIEPFGVEAWAWLLTNAGLVAEPRTYEVWTPSGGIHLYWQANPELKVKTVASKLGDGIDVRAINGSITAAGSTTETGEYELKRDSAPRSLPSWLRTLLRSKGLATSEAEQASRPAPMPTSLQPSREIRDLGKWREKIVESEIERMSDPSQSMGYKNADLNRAALKLRKHVDDGNLDLQTTWDRLYDAALQIGMTSQEAQYQLRRVLEQGR